VRAASSARLDVGGNRNLDRGCDAANCFQHLPSRNALPVGISQAEGDAGAGGGDGPEARVLNHPRAGHIPGIGQQENLRATMHCPERFRLSLRISHD
jgi:hypothetical protein